MLLFFLFLFVIAPGLRSPGTQVSYSQFRKEVKAGKVLVEQNEIKHILKADLPQTPQPSQEVLQVADLMTEHSAEETVLAEVSTGASNDIQKATDLAEWILTLYRLSQKLVLIAMI